MRRIPLSRRSHVTGFGVASGAVVPHESALERDFGLRVSFLDAGAVITSQPVTISFSHDERQRRYTPDFHVRWSDGLGELVEIKYRADLRSDWAKLRPAFAAAIEFAKARSERFRIATERDIRDVLLDNARRLLPLRRAPLDVAMAEAARAIVCRLRAPTLSEAVAAMPCDRVMALGVMWRLMARGDLVFDLHEAVGLNTRLRLS